jgi:hypothetical protein
MGWESVEDKEGLNIDETWEDCWEEVLVPEVIWTRGDRVSAA